MQCDYFDAARCRSCTLMGMPYAAQLASKQQRCDAALAEAARSVTWRAPRGSAESAFRNKAKLVVGGSRGAVTLGILDEAGRGVDLQQCGLYEAGLSRSFPQLAEFVDATGLEPYEVPARSGELKNVIVTHSPDDELMVRFVLRSRRHEALIRSRLPRLLEALPRISVVSLNILPEHRAVLEGDHEIILTPRESLSMLVNGLLLHLRPNSFFQTNTDVTGALYRQAQQWISQLRPRSVWDLYCGVGGFALHAAASMVQAGTEGGHVLGIETSPEAVESARLSATELGVATPGLPTLAFRVGDATSLDTVPAPRPDLVVVNPPRRGLGAELAQWIERSAFPHVIYSSCNVDSLSRDLAAMPSLVAREARLFDMFPQTHHHEVMVRLERQQAGMTGSAASG